MAFTTACTGWFSKLSVTVPAPPGAPRGVASGTGWMKRPLPRWISGAALSAPLGP